MNSHSQHNSIITQNNVHQSKQTYQPMKTKFIKTTILEYMAYGIAFIAILVGLASVFESTLIAKNHDKAIYWFIFAILAILIPYVREITFKDMKVVIDKIDVATKTLDNASISVKELNNRINQTRDELIDEYLTAVKNIQQANGLGDDGIFGYRTLNLLYQLRNKDEKT